MRVASKGGLFRPLHVPCRPTWVVIDNPYKTLSNQHSAGTVNRETEPRIHSSWSRCSRQHRTLLAGFWIVTETYYRNLLAGYRIVKETYHRNLSVGYWIREGTRGGTRRVAKPISTVVPQDHLPLRPPPLQGRPRGTGNAESIFCYCFKVSDILLNNKFVFGKVSDNANLNKFISCRTTLLDN